MALSGLGNFLLCMISMESHTNTHHLHISMDGRKVNQDDQTWINNDCGSTWAWGELGCAAMESLAWRQVWGVGEHQILTYMILMWRSPWLMDDNRLAKLCEPVQNEKNGDQIAEQMVHKLQLIFKYPCCTTHKCGGGSEEGISYICNPWRKTTICWITSGKLGKHEVAC